MAKIIDGKAVAAEVKRGLKEKADFFESKYGRKICLAVIIAGDDPASAIYVRNKVKACEETNVKSLKYALPASVPQSELNELIDALAADDSVDGILVQVPLPAHLDEREALSHIPTNKDVDGFSAENVGKLVLKEECSKACTPSGIIELIDSTGVEIEGKRAVVVGRSNTVGKPVALMLLERNATVTVCHSRTRDLASVCREADILVSAVGKARFITADMVKEGAIVIDVGMNRVDGKLYGDVDFDPVSAKASYITPVPGGVGPMTVAMLLNNTVKAAYRGK